MGTTNHHPTIRAAALRPARLADEQLRHFENMVQYITRADTNDPLHGFDHQYWEKRIRALADTHELVATQRHRVSALLDQLARSALTKAPKRTAA